jgi:hypothetical protein
MNRHLERSNRSGRKKTIPQRVGWPIQVTFLAAGLLLLAIWWRAEHAGRLTWLNQYRQPVFAPMLFICGIGFLILGLIPWDWLNRKAKERVHRGSKPYSHDGP